MALSFKKIHYYMIKSRDTSEINTIRNIDKYLQNEYPHPVVDGGKINSLLL